MGALSFTTSTFELSVAKAAFSSGSMGCFGLASHPYVVGLRLALRTEVTVAGLTPNPVLAHVEGGFCTQNVALIILLLVVNIALLNFHKSTAAWTAL